MSAPNYRTRPRDCNTPFATEGALALDRRREGGRVGGMKKLPIVTFVALLMAGDGVGDSGSDGPESNQTTTETSDAKTAEVGKIDLEPAKEERIGKKPFTIPGLAMEMLWCKPGTFTMGSPKSEVGRDDDKTLHAVTLTHGFWLGKHEVTQAQWQSIMGTTPSKFKGPNLPVETVSWDEAVSFCKKLTEREKKAGRLPAGWAYALPTEAQWEYACRAGTRTAYSFGNAITEKQANFKGTNDNIKKTTPVGSYGPNAWGFHDMHGNVWEWCSDWYGGYPKGAMTDPTGPAVGSLRVIRGGSWFIDARYLRSAFRSWCGPVFRFNFLGFRPSLRLVQGRAE